MFGVDERIAELGGGGVVIGLLVALLLGLRHATDPDHLTAVCALVMSDARDGARRARVLGLSWGLGHAVTLVLLGLPVVLFHAYLPEAVHSAAEIAIGAIIVALALRLLVRWRRGQLHAHEHSHGALRHAHPHVHEHGTAHAGHHHAHPETLGRTPLAAFGIGLLHGVGGSAGIGILLIGSVPEHTEAVASLLLFAAATALAMALLSSALGVALTRGSGTRGFDRLAPAFGTVSLLFGVWYALGALGTVPYAV